MNYSALSALTLTCEQELNALRHHFIVGGQIQVYNQHLALKPLIYIFFWVSGLNLKCLLFGNKKIKFWVRFISYGPCQKLLWSKGGRKPAWFITYLFLMNGRGKMQQDNPGEVEGKGF